MNIDNGFNSLIQQNSLKCDELDVDVRDLYKKNKSIEETIENMQDSTALSLNEFDQRLTIASGEVSSLSSNVSSLTGSVSTLSSDVSTINNSLNSINADITNIYNLISSQTFSGEKVDVLYDKNSTDSLINKGYTSGIGHARAVVIDFTGYKFVRIHLTMYNNTALNAGPINAMILLSLENPIDVYFMTSNKFVFTNNFAVQPEEFAAYMLYNSSNHEFTPYFYFNRVAQGSNKYFVYKVEGVK